MLHNFSIVSVEQVSDVARNISGWKPMSAVLFIFFCLQSKKRKLNKTSLKRKTPAVNEGGSDSNTDAANKVSVYSECPPSSLFKKQK